MSRREKMSIRLEERRLLPQSSQSSQFQLTNNKPSVNMDLMSMDTMRKMMELHDRRLHEIAETNFVELDAMNMMRSVTERHTRQVRDMMMRAQDRQLHEKRTEAANRSLHERLEAANHRLRHMVMSLVLLQKDTSPTREQYPYPETLARRNDHGISATAAAACRNSDYAGLRRALCDANPSGIYIVNDTEFSGLELSVHTGDWKMLLTFFLAGADPATHWFRGVVGDLQLWHPLEKLVYPSVYDADKAPSMDTSGFNRLHLIVNDTIVYHGGETEDTLKVKAVLWLFERLHAGTIDGDIATISVAGSYMRLLSPDFDWVGAWSYPVSVLQEGMRVLAAEKGWDNALVDQIARPSIQDLLLRAFRSSLEELGTSISTS